MKEYNELQEARIKIIALIMIFLAIIGIAVILYFNAINPLDPYIVEFMGNQCLDYHQMTGECIIK